MLSSQPPSQPDYELDDFTTVSEWERFTSNVEECLREWAPSSSSSTVQYSPTVTASTQQQLASPWPQWLIRSCDLGAVHGQRFELVRHWLESTAAERSQMSPVSPGATSSDGNIFLDLLDSRCDFDSTPNPDPYRMFGFRDFAILRVRQNEGASPPGYLSIQLSSLLLSSLASAATAASCSLPMLVELSSGQTGALGRAGYTGISVSRVAIIDLTATLFNPPSRPPTHLSTQASGHLCYWIGVMRNHLKCPLWPQPPLQLSVRYSYYIRISFPQFDPLSPVSVTGRTGSAGDDGDEGSLLGDELIDSDEDYEDGFIHSQQQQSTGQRRRIRRHRSSESSSISSESIASNFCRLPCGIYDPGEAALEVILTWPILDDSHFTDSPVVSTSSSLDLMTGVASCRGCMLDPSTAVDWLAKLWLEKQDSLAKHGNFSRCLLTDFISGFSKITGLSSAASSSSSLAGNASNAAGGEASVGKPDRPGHWSMRLVRHLATATASAAQAALPPPNLLPDLVRLLIDSWIFPKLEDQNPVVEADFRDLKAAPSDSLIERVAVVACALSASFGQTAAVQFWQQVCARFQTLWDTGRPMPRADTAVPPDLKQSIIAQKVQLLAYCLGQRLRREREAANASRAAEAQQQNVETKAAAVGRLRMLDPVQKTMLLSGKDSIYVPETQEPEPMTEDELPLFPIESDVEPSAGVGFQHSIPCLQSDMSSFKAANPGADLIDFLRWYSPRDVNDGTNGPTLSSRMCIPDNIWQSTWEKAKPTPARRQKRLFDETRAAHSVLRWFTALTNSGRDLTIHLMPVVLGAALRRLHHEAKTVMPSSNALQHVPSSRYVKDALDMATESVVRATGALSTYALARGSLSGDGSGRSTPMEYEVGASSPASIAGSALAAALDAINVVEQRVCLVQSLRNKLSGAISAGDGPVLDEFIFSLAANCSSTNSNGTPFPAPGKSPTVRGVVLSLISSEAPSPVAISTVIRANCPRPAAFSRSLPHRLYVRFQPNSPTPSCSHLAGAFSRDIIFA